ncbi:Uncharacterized protein FWK35_00028554, partial [Aphis craccivora]
VTSESGVSRSATTSNGVCCRCRNTRLTSYYDTRIRLNANRLYTHSTLLHNATLSVAAVNNISSCVDFERSNECIDFTMMHVFLSVYSITSQNNASISNFGDGFRWQNEYPWFIKEVK